MPCDKRYRSIRLEHAVTLGAVQGLTEWLPVSSSAHLVLIPWICKWPTKNLDPELKKSFEIYLHGGTAIGMLIAMRPAIGSSPLNEFDPRRVAVIGISLLPAATAGVLLHRVIERRLGEPLPTAIGLAGGALAMAAADRRPQVRRRADARLADGAWFGVAQAMALAPGVSRSGAVLTAARLLRFQSGAAYGLSREVALPVLCGACLWSIAKIAGGHRDARVAPLPVAAGGAAACVTSIISKNAAERLEAKVPLRAFALYRLGLAALSLSLLWKRRVR